MGTGTLVSVVTLTLLLLSPKISLPTFALYKINGSLVFQR